MCSESLKADCDYVAYKTIYKINNTLYNMYSIYSVAEQLCMNNIDFAQDKCASHLHVPLAGVHRDQERQQSLVG